MYFYKGVPVRKHNVIHLRVDEITYKEIIDTEESTGLSQRKILAHSSAPCEKCIGTEVMVMTDDGTVKIKRGILSKRIPVSYNGNKKKFHESSKKVRNIITGEILDSVRTAHRVSGIPYTTLLDKLNGVIINNTEFVFYESH